MSVYFYQKSRGAYCRISKLNLSGTGLLLLLVAALISSCPDVTEQHRIIPEDESLPALEELDGVKVRRHIVPALVPPPRLATIIALVQAAAPSARKHGRFVLEPNVEDSESARVELGLVKVLRHSDLGGQQEVSTARRKPQRAAGGPTHVLKVKREGE